MRRIGIIQNSKYQNTKGNYFDHPNFKVSEDELSVSNPNGCYGTILFGPFFEQDEKIIYTASFKGLRGGHCGLGFATSKFSEFATNTHNWNMDNESRIIYYKGGKDGNGGTWPGKYFQEIPSFDRSKSEGFESHDIVCIEVNMVTKVGKMTLSEKPVPELMESMFDEKQCEYAEQQCDMISLHRWNIRMFPYPGTSQIL